MLQVEENSVNEPTPAQLDDLRDRFTTSGYVHLHDVMGPVLREKIVAFAAGAPFTERPTPGIGNVQTCDIKEANRGLNKAFSHPGMLDAISRIYGGEPVRVFFGNIVRRIPGQNHFSNWHNDQAPPFERMGRWFTRAVAFSLNISASPFEGGELEIGDLPDDVERINAENYHQVGKEIELQKCCSIANENVGDGLLFGISARRFHRVADVTAGGPRTVYVGWFYRDWEPGPIARDGRADATSRYR